MALSTSTIQQFNNGTPQNVTGATAPTNGKDIDWPGTTEFADLGAFRCTVTVRLDAGPITVGVFEDIENAAFFLASGRPHAIAAASTLTEAISSWIRELENLREAAKDLKPPLGPTTENDIDSLRDFFGSI